MKDIQTLLETKTFSALTTAEQQIVLSEMTMEQYTQLHSFLNDSKASLKNDIPTLSPQLKTDLQQHFKEKHPSFITKVIGYKVPFWMVGLVFLALGFSYFYFAPKNETPTPIIKTEQIYVYKTDTIYIEKTLETTPKKVIKQKQKTPVKPLQKATDTTTPIASTSVIEKTIEQSIDLEKESLDLNYHDTAFANTIQQQMKGQPNSFIEDLPNVEITIFE